MTTEEILDGLNEEQLQAATSIDGAVRLIAGAGSGKTFTLTRRVAYIAAVKGIDPSRILSLTFTNKAAGEMRERVAKVLGVLEDVLNMKTFHSLAVEIVRRECKGVFGWNGFSIGQTSAHILVPQFFSRHSDLLNGLSDEQQKELKRYLVEKVYNALNSDYYVEWLDKSSGKIPLDDTQAVLDYMEKNKVAKSANDAYKRAVKTGDSKKIKEKAEAYDAVALPHEKGNVTPVGTWVRAVVQEGKNGICSFDDLIKCTKYLLEHYPEIKDYWSNQYDFIQVDEFQDTDSNQLAIVQALYERHGNLFVVGDPDQSIYLFRGAEPTLFNNLGNYIPNLKTIFMNTNYRSTEEIVNISDSVIELNRNRIPKSCYSKAGSGSAIQVLMGSADCDLADLEFNIIKDLIAKGTELDDIAVLYRSSKDKTTAKLQDLLMASGIPVVTTLVQESVYKTFVLGLCKYSYLNDDTFLMESASALDDSNGFNPPTVLVDPNELKTLALDVNSIMAYLDKAMYAVGKRDGKPLKSYQTFKDRAKFIQQDISDALSYWNDLTDDEKKSACNLMDLHDDENALSGKGVRIITMHRSKGLEWPYVFVNGLTKTVMDSNSDNAAFCNEQARLIYVAYSRAKTQLYMCCDSISDMHGTLAKVILNKNVKIYSKGYKEVTYPDLKDIAKHSIHEYLVRVDLKEKIKYTPLKSGDDIKGYRCNYSVDGEVIAYQAVIEDLERLNCVPKEQRQIVIITEAIPIAKIEGKDLICFDELDKSIRRITLTNDDEIKTVFGGSNTLYVVDTKNDDLMRSLKAKYVLNQKDMPKPEKKEESVTPQKPVTKVPTTPQTMKKDKDSVAIPYAMFEQYSKQKRGHKVRIIEYKNFNQVVCLEVDTKQQIIKDMNSLVEYLKQGIMYFTNPSVLQNYGFWAK